MPASSLEDTGASNSRAFDFANLASEAIAAIEVYKTSRASTPTGGIGATINIKTTRPLDKPGLHTSFGVKGVIDTSADNLPEHLQGDSITPEISGIFSNTFGDDKFGVALTRELPGAQLGFNQAAVGNGWRPFAGDENNWGTIPQPGAAGLGEHHQPSRCDRHLFGAAEPRLQRQRHRAQAHQRPADAAVAAGRRAHRDARLHLLREQGRRPQRNELSVWFNFGPSASSWTDGPVAAPLVYSETDPRPRTATCRWAARSSPPRTRTSRWASIWRGTSPTASASQLDFHDSTRGIRRRQPVRLERGARRRRLLSRHDHGRLHARTSRS